MQHGSDQSLFGSRILFRSTPVIEGYRESEKEGNILLVEVNHGS